MALSHHTGSCQCGAVSFEADVDLDRTVICNCSRCRRLGAVLAFGPRDQFRLLSGGDKLKEYQFNKHKIRHLFCETCDIQSFSFSFATAPDGKEMAAVNANCLDDVDARSLTSHAYDGASM